MSTNEKVTAVQAHLAAVVNVIDGAKKKQLGDEIIAADMAEPLDFLSSRDQ
jgi:hypothetical protein